MSALIDPIVNGFMLGMSTGPVCFTACVPLLLSMTLAEGGKNKASQTWLFVGKFVGGRFLAYLGFGLIMGLVGSRLGTYGHRAGIYASLVLSVFLIIYGLGMRLPHFGLCRISARGAGHPFFPVFLGGITGLNVCPPFLLAIAFSLERGVSPLIGLLFFASFFVATTLYILPVGFAGYVPRVGVMVRIGRIAAIGVGLFFLFRGISALRVL